MLSFFAIAASKPPPIPCVPGLPCITEETQASQSSIMQYIVDTYGSSFISSFLGVVAATSVVFIIVGGLQVIFALGNEDTLKRGKMTLVWAIAGLVISILSVAMVQIVSNLFAPDAAGAAFENRAAVVMEDSRALIATAKDERLLPPKIVKDNKENRNLLITRSFKFEIIPETIRIMLALAGTVVFGVLVYAGIMLIYSEGNEEAVTKFKKILIWTVIGLIFITVSYALVRGVMQLVFK